MSRRIALTALSAVAPLLAGLLLAVGHTYIAFGVVPAGLVLGIAAVSARGGLGAWIALAANAVLVALFAVVAIYLSSDSS